MASALRHEREEGTLLNQLACLIEQLRTNRYASIIASVQDPPSLVTEDFADLFSRHLLFEEEILFPVLREPAPDVAGRMLEDLRTEHGKLRSLAQDLVCRVRGRDLDGACEIGRLLMAALLLHLERETEVTRKLLGALGPRAAARLEKVLEHDRDPG